MASADGAAFPLNSAAVAIDKDKNSQYAVKWAIDHFVSRTNLLILIHVRPRNPGGADAAGYDTDPKQIFTSYRGFCARKSIQLKEIILEDNDAGRAILEFVKTNFIANIVVGGCTRNAIVKTFKKPDVPSYLTKNAPEFCSVYVIGKSKILSVRSASRPVANTATPPKLPGPQVLQQQPSAEHAPVEECGPRTPARRVITSGIDRSYIERNIESMRSRLQPMYSWNSNLSAESLDMSYGTPSIQGSDRSSSISDDDRILDPFAFRNPIDVSANKNSDFSFVSDPRRDENPSVPQNDLEAEMRRLRLELKQTMDMYSTACREAITAKHKAKELNDWKMTELRKYEQARYAEESALATIEMEKAKCRAAMEAAEAAQRLAEKEAQKRKLAEEKAKREAEGKKRALTQLAHKEVRYRKYTIEEVEIATDKFSMQFKIGEGGYGPVFRGVLDHTPVAIKILRPDAAQGQKQFQQEVEVLSCMRHPNMVLLLGACPEYGCLVYEYMNNGSLEDRLLRKGGTPPIPWRIRFRIAAEIATGLSFLHQAKPEPLVHRDLKPANILLDQNYVSKISDVGLARLVPPSVADTVTQYHMTSAAGTFCYIDPEYQQTGMLTTKSDVYSFGIMLLQIITAKPAMGLSHQVQRSIDRGTFSEILDPTVCDWPLEETLTFAKLALKCCELRKRDRPDLSTVVLPVLNRLKELGTSEDDNNFYGYHLTKHPSMSRDSGGSRSSLSQEDISSQMSDQKYNPGVDFGAGAGLVFIPGKDKNGSYRPLVSHPSPVGPPSSGVSTGIIAGICAAIGLIALLGCWYFGCMRRKRSENALLSYKSEIQLTKEGDVTAQPGGTTAIPGVTIDKSVEFSYVELSDATNNFSLAHKIGEGGFAVVYYGELRGEKTAIKKMDMQATKEFLAELKVLSHIHHLNLVRLIGYCVHRSLFLVYEYIENGTLSQHLHSSDRPLSWTARVQIALDSARGLEYIHEHTVPVYIHRDIKSPNILIDNNFRAKVADFGLTKLVEVGTSSLPTGLQGTFGYMPPEYAQFGEVSPKVDVFAFGVVLYELISGKKAVVRETDPLSQPKPIVSLFEDVFRDSDPTTSICTLVDPRLGEDYPLDSVFKMAELARACTQQQPEHRPTMRSVVVALLLLSSGTDNWDINSFYENGLHNPVSGR